jgi:predicted porin
MTTGTMRSVLALLLLLPGTSRAAEDPRVDALLDRLDAQQAEIQALRQEVQELRESASPVHHAEHPEYRREDGQIPVTDYDAPRIRIDIAGQINQAFNFAADGKDAKGYFVDNDASGSRLRFAGVSTFPEGPQVGSTLEIAFSPNNSFDVNQENERAGDFIAVRRAELWVRDDRYGRLMFGHGSAATDNTAEFDLSLVSGPIMTSGVEFIAGGMLFSDGHDFTNVRIENAFFNFDGQRMGRVRYDSPMFGPVQLSISAGSDQRYDAALTFGGDYDHWSGVDLPGFTGLAAIGISRPNQDGADYRVAGSGSLLHDATGLSLTVSSGYDGGTDGGTPYSVYGKLGWDTRLFPFGPIGFGVDYDWNENLLEGGDRSQSVGIAAVQSLENWGIELYTQLRWYTVDRDADPGLDDIWLGTVGTRVRF